MNDFLIDFEEIENDDSSPFEDIASHIEKIRLQLISKHENPNETPTKSKFDELYKKILKIEQKIQDLDNNNAESNTIRRHTFSILNVWKGVFDAKESQSDFDNFENTITYLDKAITLSISSGYSFNYFTHDFETEKAHLKTKHKTQKIRIEEIEKLALKAYNKNAFEQIIQNILNPQKSTDINVDILSQYEDYRKFKTNYDWNIEIKFPGKNHNAEKIFKLLWIISSSLKKINGIDVTIESWRDGSKIINLLIKVKNILANEQLSQVLENAQEELTKPKSVQLSDSFEENVKSNIKIDEDKLLTSNLRKLNAEARRIELENLLKEVELDKKLSKIIAENLQEIDDIEITINGLNFILKKGNDIKKGEKISDISKNKTDNDISK